jgi:L-threonylcarbamoyladenylate synthase
MAVILPVNPAQLWRGPLEQAAAAIRRGAIVAIPTDTVYGLAAHPFRPEAVKKLLWLKRRPQDKPILLLVESRRQVEQLVAYLPDAFSRIADRFWPGPLTVILPAAPSVPEAITSGTGTVAVRLPGSVLTRELIRAARVPLTGTSANVSGRPAAQSAAQVKQQFPRGLAFILDAGPAQGRLPSTIVDLTGRPRVIREGAIPAADVLCHC